MFGIGLSEMLVIGVIALIFIGPDQLPGVARTIGRFINELRRSSDEIKSQFRQQSGWDNIHNDPPPISHHNSPVVSETDPASPVQDPQVGQTHVDASSDSATENPKPEGKNKG